MVKLSIVVSARNEEENIGRFLDSVGSGSEFDDFEVIVVDGNSEDRTAEIAEEKGARVISGPGRGLSASRNVGWRNSKGDYVAFFDADEYLEDGFLDVLSGELDGSEKVISGNYKYSGEGWVAETQKIESNNNIRDAYLFRAISRIGDLF